MVQQLEQSAIVSIVIKFLKIRTIITQTLAPAFSYEEIFIYFDKGFTKDSQITIKEKNLNNYIDFVGLSLFDKTKIYYIIKIFRLKYMKILKCRVSYK